jgi:hypothetical protein
MLKEAHMRLVKYLNEIYEQMVTIHIVCIELCLFMNHTINTYAKWKYSFIN